MSQEQLQKEVLKELQKKGIASINRPKKSKSSSKLTPAPTKSLPMNEQENIPEMKEPESYQPDSLSNDFKHDRSQ
jgi:galactose mutarotase-like enzyme